VRPFPQCVSRPWISARRRHAVFPALSRQRVSVFRPWQTSHPSDKRPDDGSLASRLAASGPIAPDPTQPSVDLDQHELRSGDGDDCASRSGSGLRTRFGARRGDGPEFQRCLVLLSYVVGPKPMDLQFWPGAVTMAMIATVTATFVTNGGRSAWFIGALLIFIYVIFAMTLYMVPPGSHGPVCKECSIPEE
jgi:hypothetical protein